MIRAILDTNVIVSALIAKKPSTLLTLYNAFKAQHFLLITSVAILEEVEEVINREKIIKLHKLSVKQRQALIKELITLSFVVPGLLTLDKTIIERDPDDDKFIAAALEGNAQYIVSGDRDLLQLKVYQGVHILSPKDFISAMPETPLR